MKRKLFILAMVFMAGSYINADEYLPLLREGVKWVYLETQYGYNHNGYDYDYSRFYTIEMKGDTVIDGTTYKKCYRNSGVDWSNSGYIICSNTDPIALLREEGRALYAYNYDNFYFRVGQTMYDYPFWYTDDDSWYANDGKDVKLYEFNENEYFKFEGCMPFLNQNSEIFSYNEYGVNDVFIEGIGFDSNHHGDLLTPFYESSYCTCIFRSETGLHHVEDGDGNIIYRGKAYTADYTPLVQEGVRWVSLYSDVTARDGYDPETDEYYPIWEGKGDYAYFMEFRGDTIINGVNYKKLYTSLSRQFDEMKLRPVAYLREAGKHIYGISNPTGRNQFAESQNLVMPLLGHAEFASDRTWQEYELYDFNNIGTFAHENLSEFWGEDYNVNVTMRTVKVNGELRNAYYISVEERDYEYGEPIVFKIVEGIGCEDIDMLSFGPNMWVPTCICPWPLGLAQQETTSGEVIYHGPAYYGPYHGADLIDVEDVNQAINIILGHSIYSRHYLNDISDFNGDYIVDISDVNAIISRILKLE